MIGALIGGAAGVIGGPLDTLLMKIADFVIALPAIYVVLMLRASLPLVLSTSTVFWTMTAVLALVGWPLVARGVRAIASHPRIYRYFGMSTESIRNTVALAVGTSAQSTLAPLTVKLSPAAAMVTSPPSTVGTMPAAMRSAEVISPAITW